MKYSLNFEKGIFKSLQSKIDFYDDISIELCDRFEAEFWRTVDVIQENPLHFQVRYENIRIAFLDGFPYSLHFVVENDIIKVYKFLHTSQEF